MLKTRWKGAEEVRYSLREAKKVAIISCDFCANLFDTGGTRGTSYMTHVLEGWGKEVVFAKSIIPGCSESVMSRAFSFYAEPLARADTLVILSCPSGVKAALLCEPGLPLYCPLEVEGGIMITTRQESTLAGSICSACGHCVISYTGGICPLSSCPSGQHYGPCEHYPRHGIACSVDPERSCVWKEIEKHADMDALRVLQELHEGEGFTRLPGPGTAAVPQVLRRAASWTIARFSAAGGLKAFRYLR